MTNDEVKREIKFRARNADVPRCWVYGYFVIEDGHCYIINNDGKFSVIAGTEGQFTGLHDKNGKEIYEGDIVITERSRGKYGRIDRKYIGICKWGCLKNITGFVFEFVGSLYEFWNPDICKFEIIGNIYEHPELIKE